MKLNYAIVFVSDIKKKTVSCVLVTSLLFSIGCYSTGMVTKEELEAKTERVDITVWTKESLKYEFSKEHYRIQGDTLLGVQVSANPSVHDSFVAIALADITSIEATEFSQGKTNLLVLGSAVGATAVILGIIAIAVNKSFK